MNKKLLQRIDQLFADRLQVRTAWGRKDVLQLYRECVSEALMELLE